MASFGTLTTDAAPPEAPKSETPFRIAILGDFTGRANRGEKRSPDEIAEARAIKINRENFDDVMAGLGIELNLPFGDDTVAISFSSLDDFHPDQVYDKVDSFDDLDDDDEKSEQMRAILHHADFQSLEAAWRGLDWLFRRALKGDQVQAVLYDITLDELVDDLNASDELSSTALYRRLIEKATQGPKGEPWAVWVGNYVFNLTDEHAGVLGRLAKIAREGAVPFLSSVHVKWITGSPGDDDAAAWQSLRDLPESAMLGLAAPRFLLRLPYGSNTKSIDKFEFEEFADFAGPKPYVWGNAGLAVAALVAQGFQKEGWAFQPGTLLDLADMPLHTYVDDDEEQVTLAEKWLERKSAERLGSLGVMALLCVKGRDSMQFARLGSVSTVGKNEPLKPLVGRWGQKGVLKLPSSRALDSVQVGLTGGDSSSGSRDVAAAAVVGSASSDVRDESPSSSDESMDSPVSDGASDEAMDPELAALLAQTESSGSESSDSSESAAETADDGAGASEMDPELAALMAQLDSPSESGGDTPAADQPAADAEMDPELSALLKQMEENP